MGGALEAELRRSWDGSDVLFPELVGFGMALKSMQDWEDQRAVQFLLEPMFAPVCTSVINGCESGSFGWRRVCMCILGVATTNLTVFSCSEHKEKTLHRLLNTGRTC